MPLQLNTNVPPYYNDFDPLKNYYQTLFKPGFPVQARELTQLQSQLQYQIEQLASRILATGDQVVGGEFGFDNKVAYVRASSITQGASASDFVGYELTGEVSGVKAKVMFAYDQVKDEEGKITEDVTFQVQYFDAGAKATSSTFREGEVLTSNNPSAYTAVVGIDGISRPIDTKPMGFGSNFTVQNGSYFVDGFMVRNDDETLVIEKYSKSPTCQIGFLVNESFVTSNDDTSLLDNSQGSSNFAAPGADRLKITMKLAKKPIDAKEPNFIGLVDVVQGNLQGKPDQTVKWAWLYDLLAQRTNEEEGDYIIRDFKVKRLEYVNSKNVDGLFDADENGLYPAIPGTAASERGETLTLEEAQAIYVLEVSPGKAMVQGYQVGYNQSVYLYGNKPRTPELSPDSFTYISPGVSFTLQNTSGTPDLQNITGDGNAVAFTPILMYKQFLDGFVGTATEPITYADGTTVDAPINRNKRPLETYHVIADGVIGQTQFTEIFNEGNSAVVVSNVSIQRGDLIGNATVLVSTKIDPIPTGYTNPRFFSPAQVVNEQTGYEAFSTTYNMGLLTSTFFTELLCFEDLNATVEWEVGSRILGEVSSATAIIEAVSVVNDAKLLVVSNVIGEFINGETIEQPQTNKSATLIRPGEVLGFDFYDKGEAQVTALDGETGIKVSALGATTELSVADGDITVSASRIDLTEQGRNKLIRFPYSIDVELRRAVKVNLEVETIPSKVNGYAVVLPAYVTHTLQKTKSLFSGLNDVNNFSSDISIQNAADAEYLGVADGSLFSGQEGDNWVTCDNFSGDASDQLVAGDVVSMADDNANVIIKIVKFVTAPAGSGQFRDKCFIYFTTALESTITGKTVERVRIRTKGDVQQGVVYRMPEQYCKSLESNPIKTGINYQVARQFYQNVEAGATSVTLVTNRTNETFLVDRQSSITIARNLSSPSDPTGLLGRLVAISTIDIQDNGRKIELTFVEPLAISATLKCVNSVYVTNALAKRKIIRRDVKVSFPYPESAGTILSLGKADIFQVNYIKSVSTGKFITNNYELDDGQRQNIYDIGRIILKEGAPRIFQSSEQNESGTIEVSFDYLEHENEGDFFSVDSYTHEDGINYNLIPYYPYETQGASSPSRQDLILATPLRDCIDFRPVVNTAEPYASVIAQITPGITAYESHNFRDTTNIGNGFAPRMPLANSQFQSDIEFYVGKIDTLFLDKSGQLVLQEGIQSENPIRPGDLATGLRLYDFRIQPYCMHAKTNIKLKKYDYFRYGMKEIYGLDKRIARLEDVVTLSLLEQKTLNMTVKDAVTGLDRFKSGYIVDGFNDHSRGDVMSPYYRCAIDAKRSLLRPPFFKDQVELEEVYQTAEGRLLNGNYVQKNGIATAPYAESIYSENPVATRWINLQVYNVFTWQGQLNLNPTIDTFTDITTLPDLNIEDNSLYDAMTALTTGLYELGILGTVWETNQTLIDEYVDWNTEEHADLEQRIAQLSDAFTQRDTTQEEILPPRTIGGGAGLEIQTQIFGTNITATGDIQVQKDLRLEGGEVVQTSYGDRITDITLVRTMRTIPIFFTVQNVKPNTQFYAYFDGVPVSRWVSTDYPATDYDDGKTTNLLTPNSDPKGFGQPIISCDRGRISGVFLIPNGRPPLQQIVQETVDPDTGVITATLQPQTFDGYLQHVQYEQSGTTRSFPTGDRVLRFTTEINNRDATVEDSDIVDSYAEATFTGSGIIADKQNTVVSTRTVEFVPQREELQRIINEITEVQEIQRTFVRFPIRRDDPVAQTFEVDANHENGVFVTELECFFRTKDDNVPVEAYLVPTEGHVPVHNIIPMSRVQMEPDSILRIQCTLDSESETLQPGDILTGQTSGATGRVKSAVVFESPTDNPDKNCTNYVYNVILSNYLGEFVPGELVVPNFTPVSLSTFNVVQDEVRVTRIDLTNFGEDYEDATVVFDQPELPGGVAATGIAKVSQGKVYAVEVTSPGSGYINVPSVTITSDTGDGATCTARVVDGRMAVDMGVATSDDGSAGTKFKFEAPIYLLGQQVYAFVLFSSSLEYRCYTSRIGENELETNVRVVEQPHLGSLYKSQNNGIWTEEQSEDIKFNLKKCDFFTNTDSKLQLQNEPITTHKINRDPIETNANPGTPDSKIFGDNPYIVTVYHDWHGLTAGDYVEIFGVQGDPGGIPNAEFNQLHQVVAADFRKFTIELTTPAVITEKAGGLEVFTSFNRPFEAATFKSGIIQPAGTNLTATIRTSGCKTIDNYGEATEYTRDTPVQMTPEQRFYFAEPKQAAAEVNEVANNDTFHLRGERSLKVTANLTTENEDLSPVVDLTRTALYTERNLIDRPDPNNIIFGITPKTVTFEGGFAADTLAIDDELTFTDDAEGIDYTVRVRDFNANTGRVVLGGKNIKYLNKQSVFEDPILGNLPISRITQSTPINFVPETKNFGSIYAKWMTRQFDLQNECDGIEIRMAAVFYDPTDIRIYYKPRAVGFDGDFDTLSWVPFNPDQPAPGETEVDSEGELLPTPGLCDNVGDINLRSNSIASPEILKNSDLYEMRWTFQDVAKFDAVAFKVVLLATNPAKCPLVDDIRIVCSE